MNSDSLVWSSVLGALRGIVVHTVIYPLEVIKIRLQCKEKPTKSFRVAKEIFQQEGMGAFYKGLTPQLVKTSIKQIWCWPMITTVPVFLRRYPLGDLGEQALTGLSIATIDAAISTPLERAKIISAFTGKSQFSLKERWKGFNAHWSKLSVNWVSFLTAQKYFRDRARKSSDESLSFFQLSKIGVQVAFLTSVISAPFDYANTLKQAQNKRPSWKITSLWRGSWLNALALIVHNIASISLIEFLTSHGIQKRSYG